MRARGRPSIHPQASSAGATARTAPASYCDGHARPSFIASSTVRAGCICCITPPTPTTHHHHHPKLHTPPAPPCASSSSALRPPPGRRALHSTPPTTLQRIRPRRSTRPLLRITSGLSNFLHHPPPTTLPHQPAAFLAAALLLRPLRKTQRYAALAQTHPLHHKRSPADPALPQPHNHDTGGAAMVNPDKICESACRSLARVWDCLLAWT